MNLHKNNETWGICWAMKWASNSYEAVAHFLGVISCLLALTNCKP